MWLRSDGEMLCYESGGREIFSMALRGGVGNAKDDHYP